APAVLIETGGIAIAVLAGIGAGGGKALYQREDLQTCAERLLLVGVGGGVADRDLASRHGRGGEGGSADDGGGDGGDEGPGERGGHGISPVGPFWPAGLFQPMERH